MQAFVALLSGERLTLNVDTSDTIQTALEKIQDMKGFTPDQMALICEGMRLETGQTFEHYGIKNEWLLNLVQYARPKE